MKQFKEFLNESSNRERTIGEFKLEEESKALIDEDNELSSQNNPIYLYDKKTGKVAAIITI